MGIEPATRSAAVGPSQQCRHIGYCDLVAAVTGSDGMVTAMVLGKKTCGSTVSNEVMLVKQAVERQRERRTFLSFSVRPSTSAPGADRRYTSSMRETCAEAGRDMEER